MPLSTSWSGAALLGVVTFLAFSWPSIRRGRFKHQWNQWLKLYDDKV
jgi:hypothetical protein